ncbi:hypothetical protein [Halobacillus naozhouensis]|uniref:YesK-like protein n=1 Tax=Halobacillus naozhouensis TaxID=554880 RepID=A0ABY8IWC0_9BACI|nr:hypothetical protein [Halobacillus naozhouensis]WFT73624.1 hypothetical protein P9989_14755 [Halobacillus naozhouensis]
MLKNILFQIIIGVITILFSSYALITHNEDILLLPFIQGILGFIIVVMLACGISAFRRKRKGLGLFFTFVTIFLFTIALLNNTMAIEGIIPILAMYIVFGVPIGIIVMLAHRVNTRNEL